MSTDTWMHFDVQGPMLAAARDCEAEVFHKWFGNTRAQLDEEYGPYEDRSVFIVLADRQDEVLGAARLIAPGGRAGLKTLVDVGRQPWGVDGARAAAAVGIDLTSTWEVATLGVRQSSSANGQRLSLALYHGLIIAARANRATSFVAILDRRLRHMLTSVGFHTQVLPGTSTAPYLGSDASTPVYAHCATLFENQRKQFPDAHRLVTLGVGLDGVAVPAFETFRRRPRPDEAGDAAQAPLDEVRRR